MRSFLPSLAGAAAVLSLCAAAAGDPPPAATVSGTIELGPELAGAHVRLLTLDGIRVSPQTEPTDPAPSAMWEPQRDELAFEIPGVQPGDYGVRIYLHPFLTVRANSVTVPPAGIQDLTIRASWEPEAPDVRLSGTVSKSFTGARKVDGLLLQSFDGAGERRVSLDRKSRRFFCELPPGRWRAWPLPRWQSFVPVDLDVPSAGKLDVALEFERAAHAQH